MGDRDVIVLVDDEEEILESILQKYVYQGISFAFKMALNNTDACRQDTVILLVTSLFLVNPVSSKRRMPAIMETAVIYNSSSFLKRCFG